MTHLAMEGLAKRYPGGGGVSDVTLRLREGEAMALIGPSGAGKTTTLRLLAGFERPDAGRILLRGADVTALGPAERRFGMVFQHYALFPHLTVGENVAFGLAPLKLDAAARRARVAEALARVEMAGAEDRAVGELSGGQQQRVALARAVAPAPAVLLLDEPLSNLDPSLRERTRHELRELIRRIGITTVIVTHEQEDAFALGDEVALLLDGRVAQAAAPDQLYREPVSHAVAAFVGRGRAVAATLVRADANACVVKVGDTLWSLPPEAARTAGTDEGLVLVFARPESLWFDPAGGAPGVVREARFAGAVTYYRVELEDGDELEVAARPGGWRVGEAVTVMPSRRGGGGLHCYPLADG